MRHHRLEVADVLHAHQEQFLERWRPVLSRQQHKALRDIGLCRTAALGAHLQQCDACSYQTVAYLSCRNRHCPKCQSTARDRWLSRQAASLLPVPYSHVVFTLPEQLAPLALRNQCLLYDLLFRAASETLLQIAADPRHLGARIGILAVLHTWSQNLRHHPHLHCLVPAGGLAPRPFPLDLMPIGFLPAGARTQPSLPRQDAGLPQAGLSEGRTPVSRQHRQPSDPRQFYSLLCRLQHKDWVVYAKPPFGGPEHVLKYLARYTHRVAIANGRLLDLVNGQVRFRWRDSKHNNRIKVMSLDAVEFIRRFLLQSCPRASSRSATSACWPTAIADRRLLFVGCISTQSPQSQPRSLRNCSNRLSTAAALVASAEPCVSSPGFQPTCLGHLYNAGVH